MKSFCLQIYYAMRSPWMCALVVEKASNRTTKEQSATSIPSSRADVETSSAVLFTLKESIFIILEKEGDKIWCEGRRKDMM